MNGRQAAVNVVFWVGLVAVAGGLTGVLFGIGETYRSIKQGARRAYRR